MFRPVEELSLEELVALPEGTLEAIISVSLGEDPFEASEAGDDG